MTEIRQIQCGTEVISYRIFRKQNKHTYFVIKNNILEVRASLCISDIKIENLIRNKSAWIISKLHSVYQYQSELDLSNKKTNQILVWGELVNVELSDVCEPHCREDVLLLPLSTKLKKNELLKNFYKVQTQDYLSKMVPLFSEKMKLYPTQVNVKYTTSQWGSCSVKDALSFSLLCAQLPESLVDYLIVHELAHIKHKNHQAEFWKLVETHCLDVSLKRKRMRTLEKNVNWLKNY